MSKFEYLKLADAVAAEIASGALKPGSRLPPQRVFAYERKIAASTASRVYAELLRRGLVVGEVGRGTFISGEPRGSAAAPGEPQAKKINFEINYPLLPIQSALIAKSLEALNRPEMFESALKQVTSAGTQAARTIAAEYLNRQNPEWSPKPDQIVFTANGRQCVAATLAAIVPSGGRCGVEALTYTFIKGIAARLGVTLVPLAMDENGVRPDAIQKAHREAGLSAIYIQPALQNPLGMMGLPGAPTSCALSRSSISPLLRTSSTDFWTTCRRWLRWRRIAASSSTAFPRKWRRDYRLVSSYLLSAGASP